MLTGVPGVGKTTVAKVLAERLGGTHVDISDLTVREGLVAGWDEERETAIADLEAVSRRVRKILDSSEEPVIVEGHYAADIVPSEAVSLVFVLRRAPWRLKEELTARGYSEEKARENVEAELVDVCLVEALEAYGVGRVCELDTTDRTPEEVAENVLSVINGDVPCQSGGIDWLSRMESDGLLEAG
ncbi:MAG: adenylate kinase family protein [Candidatus Bathyarchaeia archaeon]